MSSIITRKALDSKIHEITAVYLFYTLPSTCQAPPHKLETNKKITRSSGIFN